MPKWLWLILVLAIAGLIAVVLIWVPRPMNWTVTGMLVMKLSLLRMYYSRLGSLGERLAKASRRVPPPSS